MFLGGQGGVNRELQLDTSGTHLEAQTLSLWHKTIVKLWLKFYGTATKFGLGC